MMHPHVPILPAAGVSPPHRIHGDGVERAEMALDTANFILEDAVVEARFELALARAGGGNVRGGLTTAEDDEVFFRRDGGG